MQYLQYITEYSKSRSTLTQHEKIDLLLFKSGFGPLP